MKYFTLLILIVGCMTFIDAQEITLQGKVTSSQGELLTGINVFIVNTYDGTTTDLNGEFQFNTEEVGQQLLRFQSIGFETKEVEILLVDSIFTLDIQLKESINELSAVTITAGAMEASDEKKAVVLRPIDIVTVPGAMGDIVGALQTLPGTSAVGNDGRLFVRGGDASETAIFIDGMKVGNAYGSTTSNVPTRTRFNPNLFKGSFFSTGGYSAEFGQALSSALSLSTVEMPLRNQGDISIMSLGGGYSQTITSDRKSLTASANYFDLRPYQKLIPQNFDWESGPRSWDAEISARHKMGQHGIAKIYARTEGSHLEIWQPQPGLNGRGDLVSLRNRYNFAQTSFRTPGKNDWSYYGGFSFSHNVDDINIDELEIIRKNQLIHGKIVGIKSFSSNFSLKTGLESYSLQYSDEFPVEGQKFDFFDQQFNLFTEGDYYFSNKLIMRAGMRSGFSTLAREGWIDPRISLAYKMEDDGQFSLAAGTFSQLPMEEQRVMNPNLVNTKAQHLILNYFKSFNSRTLRVEAFYKNYDNLVTSSPSQDLPRLMQQGKGYARGFDIFFRDRKSIKNTDFWVSYSYIDSKRKYNDFTSLVQPGFAPRNNFSVVVKHFVTLLQSQLSLSFIMNDGYTYTNPNIPGEMNSKTKGFQDVSLGWSYLPKPNLIIHLACSNILGRDNIFGYNYSSQPGAEGSFASLPVRQGAPRFLMLGIFLTISKDKSANQLNNL